MFNNETQGTESTSEKNNQGARAALFIRSKDPAIIKINGEKIFISHWNLDQWHRVDLQPGTYEYSVVAGPGGEMDFGTVLRSGSINIGAWDVVRLDVSNNFVGGVFNSVAGLRSHVNITRQHTSWYENLHIDVNVFPFGNVHRGAFDPIFGYRAY